MKGKVIVITGASSGIGRAFVEFALKNISNSDVLVGLSRAGRTSINKNNYLSIKMDLRQPQSIRKAVEQIKKRCGKIDVLINNAGLGYRGTIEDLSTKEIKDQFEVNLFGPIYLTQLVLPIMRKQKSGHIINVDSVASVVSTPTLGYYAATKAATHKISEVLAQEVEQFGIKVSLFIPGAVKTKFGKNIRPAKLLTSSSYSKMYNDWQKRFKYFFKAKNTSEEAAERMWNLLETKQRVMFVSFKDKIMCSLKSILPGKAFNYLFLNYYYKNES